ncbi:MAG: adenosylcobinamide-GDP ribazoletransferase, partial [Oscillospiraceae bacterium]|nr:adenosylcobinamide-GDP ribazoletransferase [Oscillospiraceae bacterium]
FGDREKKLSIMSDAHIGSFAAIYLAVYLLLQPQFTVRSEI